MVERHDIAHGTDAHAARACARSNRVQTRRRHPALVRTEVMFDAEAVIEAKSVAEFKLAPQLLITLVRVHSRLAPDMRKMRELHYAISSTNGSDRGPSE